MNELSERKKKTFRNKQSRMQRNKRQSVNKNV